MRVSGTGLRLIIAFLLLSEAAATQTRGGTGDSIPLYATVVVRVRSEGAPLPGMAIVRLLSQMTGLNYTESTKDMGQATFASVPLGRYQIEVSATGFGRATEDVDVLMAGATSTFIIDVRSESATGAAKPADNLTLAPKARKELDKAVEAMRQKKFKEAEESLQRVIKMAPGHPDAYYLLAMVCIEQQNRGAAQQNLKKALQLYPDHVPSLISLSTFLFDEGSYKASIANLERAVQLNPDSA